MINVKLPNGGTAQFPDGMPPAEIERVLAEQFGGQSSYDAAATGAGAPVQGMPQPFANSQPVTPRAAPQPNWQQPGAIVPIQFPTNKQTNGGWPRLAVPQLATDAWNAVQAPGKAMSGEYDQLEVDPQTGAVAPFDTRMMDDAANLASMVSPITPASRFAMLPAAGGARAVAKAATPEIDDLYAAKASAYQAVDNLGARYSDDAVDSLYGDMIRRASVGNISETRHPKAYSMLVDLQQNPRSMSLTELDQLRQVIRRDLVGGDAAETHFGREFIAAIDDFIENAGPSQISGVSGQTANFAITTARKANTVLRKSETLQDALDAARLRAASSGSGGNIDNTIRQELRKIVLSPKKSMGFTPAELAMMEKIIEGGGKLQDVLRLVGKLSPSGSGLMAALGIGGTMANPLAAVVPAVGIAAKAISDRATQGGVQNLTNVVRSGGPVTPLPRPPGPLLPKANTTLLQQNFGPAMLPSVPGRIRLET